MMIIIIIIIINLTPVSLSKKTSGASPRKDSAPQSIPPKQSDDEGDQGEENKCEAWVD